VRPECGIPGQVDKENRQVAEVTKQLPSTYQYKSNIRLTNKGNGNKSFPFYIPPAAFDRSAKTLHFCFNLGIIEVSHTLSFRRYGFADGINQILLFPS